MDYLAAINGLQMDRYQSIVDVVSESNGVASTGRTESFENLFQSALNMVKETNELSNLAQEEEINFSMGYTDNMHDLLVAQQKANLSLQYTVAIRNSVMDAYREIMNLQF